MTPHGKMGKIWFNICPSWLSMTNLPTKPWGFSQTQEASRSATSSAILSPEAAEACVTYTYTYTYTLHIIHYTLYIFIYIYLFIFIFIFIFWLVDLSRSSSADQHLFWLGQFNILETDKDGQLWLDISWSYAGLDATYPYHGEVLPLQSEFIEAGFGLATSPYSNLSPLAYHIHILHT